MFARLAQDLQAATTATYPAAWGTMVGGEMCVLLFRCLYIYVACWCVVCN